MNYEYIDYLVRKIEIVRYDVHDGERFRISPLLNEIDIVDDMMERKPSQSIVSYGIWTKMLYDFMAIERIGKVDLRRRYFLNHRRKTAEVINQIVMESISKSCEEGVSIKPDRHIEKGKVIIIGHPETIHKEIMSESPIGTLLHNNFKPD